MERPPPTPPPPFKVKPPRSSLVEKTKYDDMSKIELIELIMGFEYFSSLNVDDLNVLNALRLMRDGFETISENTNLNSHEREVLLNTGSITHGRVLETYRKQANVEGSRQYQDVYRLWSILLRRKENNNEKDSLKTETMEYFLRILNTFVVGELEKLEKESNERAAKATTTEERVAWEDQADQFCDMVSMNESDYNDKEVLESALKCLNLTSSKDSLISKETFLAYLFKAVIPRLPERGFMKNVKAKKSREFVSQMSLRFSSSSSFC